MIPPTDEQGRFQRVLVTSSIFRRVPAKLVDAVIAGIFSASMMTLMPAPWQAVVGTSWFILSDFLGSPGKWLFRMQVVRLDGSRIGFMHSVFRNGLLGVPTIARAVIVSGWWGADADAAKWDRLAVALLGIAVTVTEIIGMALQAENRRFGDNLAQTRVVDR